MELIAYRGTNDLDFDLRFWRTKTDLEVDFILDDAKVAIECKISRNVSTTDLYGIKAFCEEHHATRAYVVSQDAKPRKVQLSANSNLLILPWQEFLARLREGEIIN